MIRVMGTNYVGSTKMRLFMGISSLLLLFGVVQGAAYLPLKNHSLVEVEPPPTPPHLNAIKEYHGQIHGANAKLSVWKPITEQRDMSLAQIWLTYGDRNDGNNFESIEVGWMVYPDMYGDSDTHFFTFYTTDNYQNVNCYNMNENCPGFELHGGSWWIPGMKILDVSNFDGYISEMEIRIQQEQVNKHWILYVGGMEVGLWNSTYFPRLSANGASTVQLGGEVVWGLAGEDPDVRSTTEMGSGRSVDQREALGYFSFVYYLDANGEQVVPVIEDVLETVTYPDCYRTSTIGTFGFGILFFFYGGKCAPAPGPTAI